jgi:ribonucleoside-triphosphate reductase
MHRVGSDRIREALAQCVFVAKYARYNPELKRRETYEEAIERMLAMHVTKYGDVIAADLPLVRRMLLERKILPSGRALQFAGPAILKKNTRGYNCCFSHCSRPEFFSQAFWLLLCGCGVGFSVQRRHVEQLPTISPTLDELEFGIRTHIVEDTIEGWADAALALLQSYFEGFRNVYFDYSLIRPKGAPLSSSSGKAPGHEPLREALEAVRSLLESRVANGIARLRPVDCYDILMHLSGAVLSGGVRRSATICLFSVDDDEMINAKTGDWFERNPQRSRSNNSAVLVRGTSRREDFDRLIAATREMGEPGFVFVDDPDWGTNPCGEIALYPCLDDEVGWSFCNLTSVNFAAIRSRTEAFRAARAAAILGTWQAGYMDFTYLGPVSEQIARRDALLGVSLTGMADHPDLAFDDALQEQMAKIVKQANMEVAAQVGIVAAARTTCVKPEGTQSLVVKAGNGIHPHHDFSYIRHVQFGKGEAVAQYFAKHNPQAVFESPYNKGDVVIAFPVTVAEESWIKRDTTALRHLEMVLGTQKGWVENGTVRGHAHHNVSNTILVRPEEWTAVSDFIWQHRTHFAGVSLLPASGDLDYPLAPFVALRNADGSDRPEQMAKFEDLLEAWQDVDYTQMMEDTDETVPLAMVACAGGACQI